MSDNIYSQLVDTSASPTTTPATNRIGQAVNATSQGGVVSLGQDSAGICRAARIDPNGTVAVVGTNPAGGSTLVQAASAAPAVSSQYGSIVMGRQDSPTPSTFYPLTLDQTGSLQAHLKSKTSFSISAQNVTCGTNKVLFALVNNSSMVLRLSRCSIYVPPAGGSGGALLGSSGGSTYYPVFCDLRRLSANTGVSPTVAASFTGGTSLTPVPCDSADALASGVTCAQAVTSVAGNQAVFLQNDAYATVITGIPFYERGSDPNAKTLCIRPGEGIALICTSNGTINSSTAGSGTVTASVNIMLIVTQAVS